MDHKTTNGSQTQGVAEPLETPDVKTIEKWIVRDLGSSITFLQSIQQDAELRKQMAIFLQGRIENYKNKPDPAQINVPFPPQPVKE